MAVVVWTHPTCLEHEMGEFHPESPKRLEVILQALHNAPFATALHFKEAPRAELDALEAVHTKAYIEGIVSMAPSSGSAYLDPDTSMNSRSLDAALRAAGAVVAAVDEVFDTDNRRAFCAVRPPGHHAEPDKAMGFCIFNNVAVGAAHALSRPDCERVAIVDFDVHHGNGTQKAFEHNPNVCLWSSFQYPFYPAPSLESNSATVHLCPLEAGSGGDALKELVHTSLIPVLDVFKPDCIFISAGFDAHERDPLANLNWKTQDYADITQAVVELAERHAKGRVISTLEGGYSLIALKEAVSAHIQALGKKTSTS